MRLRSGDLGEARHGLSRRRRLLRRVPRMVAPASAIPIRHLCPGSVAVLREHHSVTAATLFDEVFRRFPGWKKPSERGADYADPAEDDDWEGEPGDEAEEDSSTFDEEALPLCPEPRPAEPYPLAALGSLQGVVEGIAEAVGCEPGLAAQSVLMTASLATVGIADIDLPKIGTTGLPLFFVTIARSSERKSSADRRAIRGVKDRVAELAKEHKLQAKRHKDEVRIYAAAENQILKDKKLDRKTKAEKLQALGPEPPPLLHPVLASADMTVEGVSKEWARKTFRAAQALTTSEGGMFVSGAAMTKDMRMRTVATLCSLMGLRTGDQGQGGRRRADRRRETPRRPLHDPAELCPGAARRSGASTARVPVAVADRLAAVPDRVPGR